VTAWAEARITQEAPSVTCELFAGSHFTVGALEHRLCSLARAFQAVIV